MSTGNEWKELFVKLGIPVIIGLTVSLAVKAKKERLTVKRAFISIVCGIGLSMLMYPIVKGANLNNYWPGLEGGVIALIAISSEKIIEFFLYKFEVDIYLSLFVNAGKDFLINLITGRKKQ